MTRYAESAVATDRIEIGAERMRAARQKLRLSADEVAHRMRRNGYKVTGRTYVRWEDRGSVPRPALEAICIVLGFDIGQLLTNQPSHVPWRQVEVVLLQVAETQQVLVDLLAEQRQVVGQLSSLASRLGRVVDTLEKREAAN